MANDFDIIDALYDSIENCGVLVGKGKADLDWIEAKTEHIVINNLPLYEGQLLDRVPINLNIYVPKTTSGMVNRTRLKEIENIVTPLIQSASLNAGYFDLRVTFKQIVTDEPIFDYRNIRYDLVLTH